MSGPAETIERLLTATNGHDLDALVACFAEDYVNETPAHPARGFRGSTQVRSNWEQIFSFVPDIHAEVRRLVADGDSVWTEWTMHGTRRDGTAHEMAGAIVFEVAGHLIRRASFYLEPVDRSEGTVDAAVRAQVARQ